MSGERVTLEKAIASITKAADDLSPDEFIDYSVILDVHLTWALQEQSPEEQYELLKALKDVLESHKELTTSIAWDLVIVLLPFLESPLPKTVEAAESLIALAASTGNPREVYIKVIQGLSQLSWSPAEEDEASDDPDDAEHSGDEEEQHPAFRKATKMIDPVVYAQHTLIKFNNLLSALGTVHPRISARFPSKFLSTELSMLLRVFTKAVEAVESGAVAGIVERFLAFLKVVQPQLNKPSGRVRPPLPPRVSTSASIQLSEQDAAEDKLQSRLIASFLTHVLELYLVRTRRPTPGKVEHEGHNHTHSMLGDLDDAEERGLELGWAGKYDEQVLRPFKSKVPGGQTLIDLEREGRSADIETIVNEITFLCFDKLGLETAELLSLLPYVEDPLSEEEEGHPEDEVPAPKSADDIPLSKHGALFLLANRFSLNPDEATNLQIYPQHSAISESFMIYHTGQSQPAVIDAILFLGELALHTHGLGDIPESTERFFIYLQIFSVISTNSRSPQLRYLANAHVARCLRAHPSEAVRLSYVNDTLEHCPFESVKAAVIGILKDEIIFATTPVAKEGLSVPSTPNSIFGTSLCIREIFDVLFPDLEKAFEGGDDKAWEKFKDLHPRFAATLNLYLLLLLNTELGMRLGINDNGMSAKIDARFLEPVRRRMDAFKKAEEKEGGTNNMMVLEMTMDRVRGVKARD